jgi:hypothetical protein
LRQEVAERDRRIEENEKGMREDKKQHDGLERERRLVWYLVMVIVKLRQLNQKVVVVQFSND